MNKYDGRRERIAEQVRLIVAGAPPEPAKRQGYVIERCLAPEDAGWAQADYHQVEEQVRTRLGLPQWS
jgi:hypothetical protein